MILTLLWLGLLLLSGGGGSSTRGSGSDGCCSRASVGEEVSDVSAGKGLGEEARPVCLNGVVRSLKDLFQFFFSDFEISIVEEQSSVGACEFVALLLGESANFNV